MNPPKPLTPRGRTYVFGVIAVGVGVVSRSAYIFGTTGDVSVGFFALAFLTLISGSATVKLPSIPASFSVSEAFVITATLLYGPEAGTLLVALDGLVLSYWISKSLKESYRPLFNMSAPAIALYSTSQAFFAWTGIAPMSGHSVGQLEATRFLASLLAFSAAYFAVNSGLIAVVVSVQSGLTPYKVWRKHFTWLSLNYFCGASLAIFLVIVGQVDQRYLAAAVPLLISLYLMYRNSMERVSEAERHVAEVDRLYMSTIETLAMAVDAKDQVTHGHIRRVQVLAVGLARALGVEDEEVLDAIKAAALLHDMGKLGIPERILNKPGPLTPEEFEQMKTHSRIGAEMLSAIAFPYPVVPIVLHHHEAWDGTGYPDGLKGTEIPLGARILSVVDCYDALTSDRPYRGRLSSADAVGILRERTGTLYDPVVVERFIEVLGTLEASVVLPL